MALVEHSVFVEVVIVRLGCEVVSAGALVAFGLVAAALVAAALMIGAGADELGAMEAEDDGATELGPAAVHRAAPPERRAV